MIETIYILTIFIFSYSSGEMEPVTINWTDGMTGHCESMISCYVPEDNTIWINAKKLDKRDSCGRDPLFHEILHHIYGGDKEVHSVCNLKIYKDMFG